MMSWPLNLCSRRSHLTFYILQTIQFTRTELPSRKNSSVGYSNFKTIVISVLFMQNHFILKHLHKYIYCHLWFSVYVKFKWLCRIHFNHCLTQCVKLSVFCNHTVLNLLHHMTANVIENAQQNIWRNRFHAKRFWGCFADV